MRRHAPLTTALVSLLVLASYVAAAFVDCERPKVEGIREAARLAAAGPPPTHGAHAMPSHAEQRGHGHAAHSERSDRGHAAPGERNDHGHAAHAAMSGSPSAEAATAPGPPDIVLVPTCLCGCDQTRALVGGSLARLGATIPAVHVAACRRRS